MTLSRRGRALLFGLGLVVAVDVAVQVVFSLTASPARMLVPDRNRLWRLGPPMPEMPNPYRVEDGFRVSAEEGPADAPLVLTLGDSSIFGHDLADGETIHDAMQAAFLRAGVPARVRTLAVPGYSTLQTLEVLDEVGWDLQPRAIVIGNLWSDSTLDAIRDEDLRAAYASWTTRAELVLSYSGLFRLTRRTINGARGLPAERTIRWPQPGDTGVRRVPIDDYVQNLQAMMDQAAERGVGVVVLGLATNSQAYEGRGPRQPVWPYIDAQYRVAEARGVPWVDMIAVYRQANVGGNLWSDGLHPTGTGATLLGQALAATLVQDGFPTAVTVPRRGADVFPVADTWDGAAPLEKRSVAGTLAAGEL